MTAIHPHIQIDIQTDKPWWRQVWCGGWRWSPAHNLVWWPCCEMTPWNASVRSTAPSHRPRTGCGNISVSMSYLSLQAQNREINYNVRLSFIKFFCQKPMCFNSFHAPWQSFKFCALYFHKSISNHSRNVISLKQINKVCQKWKNIWRG